ncbi:hypothetical protein TNCT_602041 [Trichonephila clavata]|uniref:Uncharacterized protein n=1 Tax=Trichonephila clavata TaxID=2740835 RepID=A0A8X6L8Y4_TRICU|nr:hypothetical protein TNCT_602041 [Trichonephila clavata]
MRFVPNPRKPFKISPKRSRLSDFGGSDWIPRDSEDWSPRENIYRRKEQRKDQKINGRTLFLKSERNVVPFLFLSIIIFW